MFKITLNRMYLTRGDTGRFSINLNTTSSYTLSDTDIVYFIVTPDIRIVKLEELSDPTKYIFYKTGRNIVINPEDTEDLEEGIYYYQVRVLLGEGSGDLNTIIEPEEFFITPLRGV